MNAAKDFVDGYAARGWRCVPVHRPNADTGECSCGKPDCRDVGKHPDPRFWPDGSANASHFASRNLGVRLGPDSGGLADVDCDCGEAIATGPLLLPPTDAAFGRGGQLTHSLYRVTDEAASYLKLQDPVLKGDEATIIELRWPSWDEDEKRPKAFMTVFPPSLHTSGNTIKWIRDGEPTGVLGSDLVAAVRQVAAAVLIARYARPPERHALVLLIANLLVRAGWADDRKIVRFLAAVFTARNAPDKVKSIVEGEGAGAVKDARDRLKSKKPMMGLPALQEMLDPTLDEPTARKVVARVKEWLGVPDSATPTAAFGKGSPPEKPTSPRRYTPLPAWRPFPTEHLPTVIREFVMTVSAAMRCDPTFAALPSLAVCAGMTGGTRQIRLKKSWCEPAMIWAVVVGDSGTLKTPPYKRAVAPVIAIQCNHIKAHKAAMAEYNAELREYERLKRRSKDDDPGDPPVEPVCDRVYTRDTTIEALAGLLTDNRSRFLIGRDEISGWLASFNQYKAKGGSDQANWLELHSLGTLCVDRKTGEPRTIFVHGVGVSLCGGIQPGVLRTALSPQHFSAGVPARLLFAYPPRRPKKWTEDDIDESVENRYHSLVKRLAELEPNTDDEGEPYPVTLDMTPEAKDEWVRFYHRFADKQSQTEGDLAAAFSKLEGYAARLALLHHVCQSVTSGGQALEPVTLESIHAGIALAEWFTYEAERVYQMLGEEAGEEETRKLVEKVTRLAEEHDGRVTVDQLRRSNKGKYSSADLAQADLDCLVSLGVGRWEELPPGPKGGRPTRAFTLEGPIPETPKTSERDPDGDEAGDDDGGTRTHPDAPEPPPVPSGRSVATHSPTTTTVTASTSSEEVLGVSGIGPCGLRNNVGECRDLAPLGGAINKSAGVSGPTDFQLITDESGVQMAVGSLKSWTDPVSVDTETTGLNPARDRVRLLQLAMGEEVCLIDLFAFDNPTAALMPLFAVLAEKEIVGHNLIGFDLPFLARLGFAPGSVFDTAIASRVVYAGENVDHDLASVVHRELGRTMSKAQQKSDWSAATLTSAQLAYAAADVAVLVPLAEALRQKAAARKVEAVLALEMACALPVSRMAARGVGFATEPWNTLADAAGERKQSLVGEMNALAPNPDCLPGMAGWNWDSNTVDVPKAFATVGIKLKDTKEETLAGIDHPLARALLDYREASKKGNTYGRAWVEEHVTEGRVYATWNQCQAKTGRMSCKGPNLQQIPRDPAYRKCFVAREGHVLVKCDFSQIELRIAAKVTGDKRMLAAYRNGEDLHTLTAARFLGVTTSAVTKEARQMAKPVNFGAIYGLGPRSLRLKAKAEYGKDMTEKQAKGFLDAFFAEFIGVRAWHNTLKRQNATEMRTLGNRRIAVEANQFYGAKANYVIQGTGGDGLKRALVLLWERRGECPNAEPVLAVHDEIVLEAPAADAEQAKAWLEKCMIDAMMPLIDPVPVEVESRVGRTWGG